MCSFNRTDDPPQSILPDSDVFYQKLKEVLYREQLALLGLVRSSTLHNPRTFGSTIADSTVCPCTHAIRNIDGIRFINR